MLETPRQANHWLSSSASCFCTDDRLTTTRPLIPPTSTIPQQQHRAGKRRRCRRRKTNLLNPLLCIYLAVLFLLLPSLHPLSVIPAVAVAARCAESRSASSGAASMGTGRRRRDLSAEKRMVTSSVAQHRRQRSRLWRPISTPAVATTAAHSTLHHLRGGGGGVISAWTRFRERNKTLTITEPENSSGAAASAAARDKEILVWIRLLFLCYYGSLGALLPYLPVYYDSIGHGGEIIGLLGAVKPATTFLVAPLWGMIADAAHQPFRILQLTFAVSLAGQLLVSYSSDARYIMSMVFLTALFNAPVKSLLDSMVLEQLADQSSYGRLRLWGQMGFGLGSSGVGILLSRYSQQIPWPDNHSFSPWVERHVLTKLPDQLQSVVEFADKFWQTITGYKLLFLAHAALSVPTWICVRKFRRLNRQGKNGSHKNSKKNNKKTSSSNSKNNSASIGQGLRLLVHNSDALLFFFLVLVVGISSGVIENFAYVRLREVGGTGQAMGLSRLVSSVAGAPMFWFSGPLSRALGADLVLVLSLVSYVVRFLIYAAMQNPYQGLPAEALRGLTFAAFWSTSTIYAHAVSPPGLHATMLMFLNAMYGGLGQSLGAIIGGKLQHRFGTVRTFVYAAAFDSCFVALLVLYLYVLLPPKQQQQESKSRTNVENRSQPPILRATPLSKGTNSTGGKSK